MIPKIIAYDVGGFPYSTATTLAIVFNERMCRSVIQALFGNVIVHNFTSLKNDYVNYVGQVICKWQKTLFPMRFCKTLFFQIA